MLRHDHVTAYVTGYVIGQEVGDDGGRQCKRGGRGEGDWLHVY